MGYILKRDLPFAKAGVMVSVEPGSPITFIDEGDIDYTCSYFGVDDLIEGGWIEEIKPREWWTILDRRNKYTYGGRFKTRQEAEEHWAGIDPSGEDIDKVEFVKVRAITK